MTPSTLQCGTTFSEGFAAIASADVIRTLGTFNESKPAQSCATVFADGAVWARVARGTKRVVASRAQTSRGRDKAPLPLNASSSRRPARRSVAAHTGDG